MRLRLGRPRAALIVAPHPDDEVIGAFGLMQALRALGTRVHVLVVSDGAASHPNSRVWPRERLVRQRRRESLWALRRLGLSAVAVRFLGLPDGRLSELGRAGERVVAGAARRIRDLDLLVGPAAGDDHPDHRAVARALATVRARRRLAYQVWPAEALARRDSRTLPVAGGALAKRGAIEGYRTQTGLIRDDRQGFAMTPAQIRHFARTNEVFVETPR